MTQITIVGNTTAPAELRFIPSGKAVTSFSVAVTERKFDKQANEWKDGDTTFYPCSVWGTPAENVAESLDSKGMRVIVQGRLKSRTYETKDGERRTVFEVEVEEVGPCLRYATAKVTKVPSGWSKPSGGHPNGTGNASSWAGQPAAKSQGADPWARSDANDEPPF